MIRFFGRLCHVFMTFFLSFLLIGVYTPFASAVENTQKNGDTAISSSTSNPTEETVSDTADQTNYPDTSSDIKEDNPESSLNSPNTITPPQDKETAVTPRSSTPLAQSPAPRAGESFSFQVQMDTANDSFNIPICGKMDPEGGDAAAYYKHYAWNIDWGDGDSSSATHNDYPNKDDEYSYGPWHSYEQAGVYTITLTPSGSTDAWLAPLGFSSALRDSGANTAANRNKLVRLLSPITPLMTRTAAQIANPSSQQPSSEWAATFNQCSNLTLDSSFTFDPAAWSSVTTVGETFAWAMFSECNGDSFTMGNTFNLPQNITTAGNNFAVWMFAGCSGNAFSITNTLTLPANLTTVGNYFASSMFDNCSGDAFTMGSAFTFPQNITTAGTNFATGMFLDCTGNSFTMNDLFTMPQSLGFNHAEDNFAYRMFENCSGSTFTMGSAFNLPQSITTADNFFAVSLFQNCSGNSFTMNDVFTLPPSITSVGNDFARSLFLACGGSLFTMNSLFNISPLIETTGENFLAGLFANCSGASLTMNTVFTMPQNILVAEDNFAANVFYNCSGASFTMNSIFNLPQHITQASEAFCYGMFLNCSGASFTMNSVFNLPQNITQASDEYFCQMMFAQCSGNSFTMNSVFNLPQNITAVGEGFCQMMFVMCSGNTFTMNTVFNLPPTINQGADFFASMMFYACSGDNFQVNEVFAFPRLSQSDLDRDYVFMWTFRDLNTSHKQGRSAVSIINNPSTSTPPTVYPASPRETFNAAFKDQPIIHPNWGGLGLTAPAITTNSLPDATVGIAYSAPLEATGSTPITWSLKTDSALPEGLSLDPSSGLIRGTPQTSGTFSFWIVATNDADSAEKLFTLTVKGPPLITTPSPLPDGIVGSSYAKTLEATSATPVTWSIKSGANLPAALSLNSRTTSLPAGLSLDPATGAISGTPTQEETATFIVVATNDVGSHEKEFSLTINATPFIPPVYTVVKHFGTWTGKEDLITAITDAPATKFTELQLDSETIDSSCYTITAGSTVITLSHDYLNTLANGDYAYTAVYTDGTVSPINLTVNVPGEDTDPENKEKDDPPTKDPTPIALPTAKLLDTGDTSLPLWFGVSALASLGLCLLLAYRVSCTRSRITRRKRL